MRDKSTPLPAPHSSPNKEGILRVCPHQVDVILAMGTESRFLSVDKISWDATLN